MSYKSEWTSGELVKPRVLMGREQPTVFSCENAKVLYSFRKKVACSSSN